MRKFLLCLFALAGLMTVLPGCKHTIRGAGKDTKKIGNKMENVGK